MLIWRSQRTSETVEFVKNNEPASVNGTPGDTWRKFLKNNGGTGETFYDLEQGYLRQQGHSFWDTLVNAAGFVVGGLRGRLKQWLDSILGGSSSYYLMEDGSSKYALEDGSGFYILE